MTWHSIQVGFSLSTYITRSRSPSPYCIFFSRVAQMVSSGFAFGMVFHTAVLASLLIKYRASRTLALQVTRMASRVLTCSEEKIPIHLRPANTCSRCSLSLKVVLAEIASMRSFSSDDEAASIFCVASFHGTASLQQLCSSSLRKPMSTRTLTNSGKPTYRRVPLNVCQ